MHILACPQWLHAHFQPFSQEVLLMLIEFLLGALSLLLGYFLPGFLASFLFFKERELTHLERLALSILLSIAIVGALMTFLGLSLGFSTTSTLIFLLIFSALSYVLAMHEISDYLRRLNYSPSFPHSSG